MKLGSCFSGLQMLPVKKFSQYSLEYIPSMKDRQWVAQFVDEITSQAHFPCGFPIKDSAVFFSMDKHFRTTYCRRGTYLLGQTNEAPHETFSSSVLALKGGCFLGAGVDACLRYLQFAEVESKDAWARCSLEHLIYVEHKAPMALTVAEAKREIYWGRYIQYQHYHLFEEPAHTVVPIMLVEYPREVTAQYLKSLRSYLSDRAISTLEEIVTNGLATYVYYYQNYPVRASHSDQYLGEKNSNIIEKWIKNFICLLAIDLMPATLESRGYGSCCGPQNAVIDGGFVDVDSVKRISRYQNSKDLIVDLDYSLHSLRRSIAFYLRASDAKHGQNPTLARIIDNYVYKFAGQLLQPMAAQFPVKFNQDIVAFFQQPRDLDELLERFCY